jgi:hypothetical protein
VPKDDALRGALGLRPWVGPIEQLRCHRRPNGLDGGGLGTFLASASDDRIETDTGWILVEHPEHARLAGRFAAHWGNAEFAPGAEGKDVLTAVARHDDAWASRDAEPFLTREGRPSAFSRELVGKYSAFEEIDLADYLAVRGRAARRSPPTIPMPRSSSRCTRSTC